MTTYMASSGIPVQALGQFGALAGVAFVNPNAAQARSNRRKKLSASRARQAASSKIGGAALSSTSSADGTVIDEKETRKQQRMLRNRESAAMSRKRKSDRVGELEEQIDLLRKENHCLRNRIFQLEAGTTGENLGVKPTDMRSPSVRNLSDVTVSSCGPLLSPMPTALPFAPINQSYTPGVASDPVITPFCSTNAGGGVISAATASFNNIVSRPAAETNTALQQQQQQQHGEQAGQDGFCANIGEKSSALGDDGAQGRVDCVPLSPSHAVIDQPGVPSNGDTLSSSSSDAAEAYDSIDHLFVELMANDVVNDSGHDGGTGEETEVERGSKNDVLLFLDGVDGLKAPVVMDMGCVRAV